MAFEKTKAIFEGIPWTAQIISQSDGVFFIPDTIRYKPSGEDSLFAETINTKRTLSAMLSFHAKPSADQEYIEEVSTLMTFGDKINGHPGVMHGGIVAAILDEAMGILESLNHERRHRMKVERGQAHGDKPPRGHGFYTADLRIKYVKPVLAPGALIVVARYVKREDKKEWINAEIRQFLKPEDSEDGAEVLCAVGEGYFVRPKWFKM